MGFTSLWWWKQYFPLKRRPVSTKTALSNIAEDSHLRTRRRESLKSRQIYLACYVYVCAHEIKTMGLLARALYHILSCVFLYSVSTKMRMKENIYL
jgi:hypothetical protein